MDDRCGRVKGHTSLQVRRVGYCLWELAQSVCGAANEGWVLRVVFVDEEHGESVTSCVDSEEILFRLAGTKDDRWADLHLEKRQLNPGRTTYLESFSMVSRNAQVTYQRRRQRELRLCLKQPIRRGLCLLWKSRQETRACHLQRISSRR